MMKVCNKFKRVSEETSKEISSPMVGTFFLQDSKELTDPKLKLEIKLNLEISSVMLKQ